MNAGGSGRFAASLLRASCTGFAARAVAMTFEDPQVQGAAEFEAWQAHFRTLVMELAAAVEDGGPDHFAARVAWVREAFEARGLSTEILRVGLDNLDSVLGEALPTEAHGALGDALDSARREFEERGDAATEPSAPDGLVAEYLGCIDRGNGRDAIERVLAAVDEGRVSVRDAFERVLMPAMRYVGALWHRDKMSIAGEHFATQTTGRLLEALMARADVAATNGRSVLLSMAEGDAHDIGLRIVAAFFELDGWRVICLGSNVPSGELPSAIEMFDVDLVVIGATLNTHREAVARAVRQIRSAGRTVKVLVGGGAFQVGGQNGNAIDADGVVASVEQAVESGRRLVGLPSEA